MAVKRGDLHRLAEAERRELVRQLGPRGIVELVRDEQHRLACPAQDVRQLGVARRQSGPSVNQEEHEVGLLDRRSRLGHGAARDRRFIRDVDAARVHEQEALAGPLAEELLAVARHARRLVDDGGARRGQPVDERRLADVGIADDGDRALELARDGGVRPADELLDERHDASTSSSEVSMWIASSAGSMREASLSSRSRRSVASASAPMSGRSDWRRFARMPS